MKTSLARIVVKKSFCVDCVVHIKKKVMEVNNVKNINLDPSKSLVVFNYDRANQVSEVLNRLIALGYPIKGDRITEETINPPHCKCVA